MKRIYTIDEQKIKMNTSLGIGEDVYTMPIASYLAYINGNIQIVVPESRVLTWILYDVE